MFKSNELKVGFLALIAFLILYFGFNYLKGNDVFSSARVYYVEYENVDGLMVSNQVMVNGIEVGKVKKVELQPAKSNKILVTLRFSQDIVIPDQTVALALLTEFEKQGGMGVAAPSANRFGKVSPTTAAAVEAELGAFLDSKDLILDGGSCEVGVESTIIDCTGNNPHILRPGAITQAMIEEVTGLKVTDAVNEIRVSGSLENHYAPEATVVLDTTPQSGDGYIAMSDKTTPAGVIRLAAPQSIEEYARILYASLRDGDSQKLTRICIDQPQGDGLAIAICDRLQRAARGR